MIPLQEGLRMVQIYQRMYFQWEFDIGLAWASVAIVGCILQRNWGWELAWCTDLFQNLSSQHMSLYNCILMALKSSLIATLTPPPLLPPSLLCVGNVCVPCVKAWVCYFSLGELPVPLDHCLLSMWVGSRSHA